MSFSSSAPGSPVPSSPPYGSDPSAGPARPGSPPRFEFKPAQLAGGALAAVTSAVAASSFGVAGTVAGAAFGSLVSSLAATVYATSLSRAGHRIRTVVVAPVDAADGTPVDHQDPTAMPTAFTGPPGAVLDGALVRPSGPSPDPGRTPSGAGTSSRPRRRVRSAVAVGGFAFLASVAAISGTEAVLGHPLGASRDSGTSVGGLVRGHTARTGTHPQVPSISTPAPTSPGPSDASPSPTGSPTGTPSGAPTDGPTGTAPSGTAPSGTAPSGTAPSGGATGSPTDGATGTVPSGGATGSTTDQAPPTPTGGTAPGTPAA